MKMINHGIICGLTIIGNCLLLSATILTQSLKVDPSLLHVYKTGLRNELDHILKRSAAIQNGDESPDSKERRSQMGTSFIRFGRSQVKDNQENIEFPMNNNFNDIMDAAMVSRIPRGRSDVIIRFGRAMRPKFVYSIKRDKAVFPIAWKQLYLASSCPNILASFVDHRINNLLHLCSSLTAGFDEREKNMK